MLPADYAREVNALRDRIADLEAENKELRQALAPSLAVPKEWRLDHAERRMIGSLYAAPNGFRSREALRVAASPNGLGQSPSLVTVRVYRLRKKVAAQGITIDTVHCEGYRLPKASRKRIERALAANR